MSVNSKGWETNKEPDLYFLFMPFFAWGERKLKISSSKAQSCMIIIRPRNAVRLYPFYHRVSNQTTRQFP